MRKKKVVRRKKIAAVDVKQKLSKRPLLELFLMALAQMYPKDVLSPGITLAFLPKPEKFYASVVRYNDHGSMQASATAGKQVLHAAQADTAISAISDLCETWFAKSDNAMAFAQRIAIKTRRRKS